MNLLRDLVLPAFARHSGRAFRAMLLEIWGYSVGYKLGHTASVAAEKPKLYQCSDRELAASRLRARAVISAIRLIKSDFIKDILATAHRAELVLTRYAADPSSRPYVN
jgi:hypothetical protein